MRRRSFFGCLAIAVLACAGAEQAKPRFALYLVKTQHADLAATKLESRPLLTEQDVVSYDWQTHALTLTEAGVKKLRSVQVEVFGKRFVIVADGRRCYKGALWTQLSSISHDRPVIEVDDQEGVFKIQRAYPTGEFAVGEDPRSDPRILRTLTALDKIKNAVPSDSAQGQSPCR